MKNLVGKKLLLLGGINHSIEIINAAHEMGVKVYVTDYNENTPAKSIADKAFTVSTTDVEAVVELCRAEKVDGVITGFIDSMLPYCAEICSCLGFPFWAQKEQLDICNSKDRFKSLCMEHGINVAKEYHLTGQDGNIDVSSLHSVTYPIIIKPSDSSGSRGVFICRNPEELKAHYPESLKYSKNGRIIAEQYIEGQHVNMYYTLSGGNILLSAMAD
ncbi:MAG: ATP-grasp domain-containing protein, partial [Synergistaceae bacterium]|nr:ATP-grasp domain-containing protein [Synergistaceae bacterium]